ncbi:MAG TPA: hypothetical protein VHY37_01760, partial [Tepidisphaeraceae bacterium]|nr:hypothetical protein [Tepidisphaeraceae bacterium]
MPTAPRAKLAPISYLPRGTEGGSNAAASVWIPIGLVFVTFGVFAWACGAEFVSWDDPLHVMQNPGLNPPTLASLWAFWAHPYQNLYIPLTYSMWWVLALVARVQGGAAANGSGMELNPWVFHTVNVLLQCGSVVLVWRLLRNLLGEDVPAAAGALLWAIHPLQVESVVWVSAGKDQLCGVFTFAALLLFVPATPAKAKSADPRRDVLATLMFVAALLAKPAAVVAPLIAAVLVAFFPHRPRRWRWLALWVLLALGDVLITKIAQPVGTPADGGRWWWRPLIACNALEFYLVKLIIPIRLVIQYNREPAAVIAG